jgi:hypothetical protein
MGHQALLVGQKPLEHADSHRDCENRVFLKQAAFGQTLTLSSKIDRC